MDNFWDVFISYGRADSREFAVKLSQQLSSAQVNVWIDINDIPLGVDYQVQIDRDIESADNFLFIISPHSVNSPYCALEIEHALRCNKRIIPLLHVEQITFETWQQRYPEGTDAEWQAFVAAGKQTISVNIHPAIRKINWVYCREGIDSFDQAVAGVLELMARDRTYVRHHTHSLLKALAWQRHQKQTEFLLIEEARQQAQRWLKTQFKGQQPPCLPTDLQCEFITESLKYGDNLMSQVFLAYAEEDKTIMEQIQRFLRRQGITVWTNTTCVQTGSDFSEAIDRGIEAADNLVYLLSTAALNSPWCQHELNYALALNKRIIPIQVSTTAGFSPELQNLQHIALTQETPLEDTDFLKILKQEEVYHREHKLLLTKALKWQQQNRNPSILLRGYNLRHSEAWLKVADKQGQFSPIPLQIEFIATSLQHPAESSLDVFISYSRVNSEFARQLNDALQTQGKTTWFDQESIASGSDFQQEIFSGIENSDNFLFVISPSSVSSPYCAEEVNYAASLNKRIVTVLYQQVEYETLPDALKTLQWIDFRNHRGDFYTHFGELVRTLDTDREHVHQHTRWYQRAIDWQQKGKSQDLLLRGSEFAIANDWLQIAQQKQPPPTALQQAFIQTSEASIKAAAERENQQKVVLRSLLGLMSIAFFTATGLGVWAFSLWRQSEMAQLETLTRTAKALFLADQKPDALVTAVKAGQQLPRIPRADQAPVLSALQQVVYGIRELRQLNGHGDRVNSVAFAPDGQVFATASDDNIVKIWTRDGTLIQAITDHQDRVNQVTFSPDGQFFATASAAILSMRFLSRNWILMLSYLNEESGFQ
ncbi:MAG: TIR domain-containing protein [Cyanobacteria bacterium P01_D01_bin.156]